MVTNIAWGLSISYNMAELWGAFLGCISHNMAEL